MGEPRYVGQRIPRVDGTTKAAGSVTYCPDVYLPRMLWGKVLRSPYAHARILNIDTRKAEEIRGVMAVVTAKDAPEEPYGIFTKDMYVLARGKVRFEGEPVAAVAAIDEETAEEALRLVEVTYEPLPAVFDPLEAMKPGAPLVHDEVRGKAKKDNLCAYTEVSLGDVESGFAEADLIHEDTYSTQVQHQGYLEPTCAVAQVDRTGHITVWTSTQGIFWSREQLADALKVPINRISVIGTYVGGSFGYKGSNVVEPIAAILARKAGRPVKIVFERDEDFRGGRPRGPQIMQLKTGAKSDGAITAMYGKIYRNSGAYSMQEAAMVGVTALLVRGPYHIPNLKVEAHGIFTNSVPRTSCRAPTGPQNSFACELQMDAIAERLGMDPYEFRLKNAIHEGDPNPWDPIVGYFGFGEHTPSIGFEETLRAATERAGWGKVRLGPNRGRGIACGAWDTTAGAPSSACVMLQDDGTVLVLTGGIDLGGLNTVLGQIVAEELRLPLDKITVVTGTTDSSPYTGPTGGSRMTYSMGYATLEAARDVRTQLLRMATARLEIDESRLQLQDERIFDRTAPDNSVTVAELSRASFLKGGPVIGHGSCASLPDAPVCPVQVAEVEVDPETGQVEVLRIVAAQDVGFAINPMAVEGQIEGGVVMGLGYALLEEYQYDQEGSMLNANFLDYKMPTALDVPPIEVVIVEKPSEKGPFGCKGVGEPPCIPTAAAIANAVYDAVGVRIKELPVTPEKVLKALGEKRDRGENTS